MNSLKDNEYSLPDVFYSEEEIIEKLQTKFSLSREEVVEYIEKSHGFGM